MGLYLSEQHGVNPSLDQCFYCMKDKGVILFGKMRQTQIKALRDAGLMHDKSENDPEAPRHVCMDMAPCNECAELMEKGIILISVDEKKTTDPKNPWRSGGWIVVAEDYIKRIGPDIFPGIYESILEKRVAFVTDEVWDILGWPRGEEAAAEASS